MKWVHLKIMSLSNNSAYQFKLVITATASIMMRRLLLSLLRFKWRNSKWAATVLVSAIKLLRI